MKLNKGTIYLPKSRNDKPVKWLCICAHQDDCEIMAIDGILKGYYSKKYSFALVETTDGGGSARTGKFKDYTDEEMKAVRIKEQQAASELGRYNSLYMLNYTSKEVKDVKNPQIADNSDEMFETAYKAAVDAGVKNPYEEASTFSTGSV